MVPSTRTPATPLLSVADQVSFTGTVEVPSLEFPTKPWAGGCTAGAVVSIVQVRPAGVASTLPAVSVALTLKMWEPSGRF